MRLVWLVSIATLCVLAGKAPGAAPSPDPARKDAANPIIEAGLQAGASHKTQAAIHYFTGGIQANPADWRTYQFRAEEYLESKEWAKAAADCSMAMRLMPTKVRPYTVRAIAYYYLGRDRDSLADINTVIKTRPNEMLLDPVNELRQRIYTEPLQFSPEAVSAASEKVNRNVAHARGDNDKATALNERAWLLATSPLKELRQSDQALADALESCALTGEKESGLLDTPAAAYAEKGNYAKAIATQQQALHFAAKNPKLIAAETLHLSEYEGHQPHRMSAADRQPDSQSEH